jgi:hypothetical protein
MNFNIFLFFMKRQDLLKKGVVFIFKNYKYIINDFNATSNQI